MDERIETKIQFWCLLGPMMLLLLFLLLFFKSHSQYFYMPLLGIFGIFACWKWKIKGCIASLILLAGLILMTYPSIPIQDRFWHVGFAMGLALTFLISFLSFEESEELITDLKNESNSRLENLLRLDEKLQKIEEEYAKFKEKK